MPIFRERSSEFEARQWDGTEPHARELIEWMGRGTYSPLEVVNTVRMAPVIIVTYFKNEQGGVKFYLRPNDWLIKSPYADGGDFTGCKPELFRTLYEMVRV